MQANDLSRRSTGVDPLEKRRLIWSSIGLATLVVISLIGAWTLRQVSESDRWVEHTREVISRSQQLLADVEEAESAERGYIITGDETYLAPFEAASGDISATLASLQKLTSDNPLQQQRLNELRPLLTKRAAVLSDALSQRKQSGFAAAQRVVVSGQGPVIMRQIRDAARRFEAEEYRLLDQRSQSRQARLRNGFIAVISASVVALVALLSAPFDVRRAVRQRNVAAQAQKESESTAQALFESASQAILITDKSGRIVMTNPASTRLLGYASHELVGHSIDLLVPDRLRSIHIDHRKNYFDNPKNRPMGLGLDLQARRKDGSTFAAEISLSYIQSAQGLLAVAFVTDISRRKADEQALRQNREDLRALTARLMTAQDDERRRIARDLHDDLSQNLAFLAMDLGKLAGKSGENGLTGELRALQLRAAEAAESVRRISHELHPSVLDDIGLEAALEQYCEEFEKRSGISTQFRSSSIPESLPREIASSIYHIAQECLRNVAKHSKSEAVSVNLDFVSDVLRLTVRDQGIGLRSETEAGRGIGMVAMKERAHLVNGKLSIQSKAGAGTEIVVEVPVETCV